MLGDCLRVQVGSLETKGGNRMVKMSDNLQVVNNLGVPHVHGR